MNEDIKFLMETLENVSFKDIDEQFVLDAEEYKTLVKDLSILEKPSVSTKEKGDRLERILINILSNSGLFNVTSNKRTSTNEIDIRVEKTTQLVLVEIIIVSMLKMLFILSVRIIQENLASLI